MKMTEIQNLTITDIRAVTKVNIRQKEHFGQKFREGWGLSLKKSGKTVYHQNGKDYISDNSHITILPYGSAYEYDIREVGDCIMFELSLLDPPDTTEILSFSLLPASNAFDIAEISEKRWTYKKPGYRFRCIAAVYEILAKADILGNAYVNSAKYAIIEPSIKYLESNLSSPDINTEMLAALSNISIPYFRKVFLEIYKVPVASYIESIRINKAKELLKSDFSSIADIAECVGYRNIYHFSKTFKKVTGTSPSAYARNN